MRIVITSRCTSLPECSLGRVFAQFFVKPKKRHVFHTFGIHDSDQMIIFMLNDPGMEPTGNAFDFFALFI